LEKMIIFLWRSCAWCSIIDSGSHMLDWDVSMIVLICWTGQKSIFHDQLLQFPMLIVRRNHQTQEKVVAHREQNPSDTRKRGHEPHALLHSIKQYFFKKKNVNSGEIANRTSQHSPELLFSFFFWIWSWVTLLIKNFYFSIFHHFLIENF